VNAIFERVVCGVDRSDAGATAAQLAARLTTPSGSLILVSVDDPSLAAQGQVLLVADPGHPVESRLVEGNPLDCLLAEIARVDATLAVVGSHDRSRMVGIVLGSVGTHLLHEAPCSVLVARRPRDPERWPRSIVVGVDGSPASGAATAVARELGARFGASVRFVAATRDWIELEDARALASDLEEVPARAVEELHERSQFADLVVVGSRGLQGVRSLGSVSERVAHEARCPVLVVRPGRGVRDG